MHIFEQMEKVKEEEEEDNDINDHLHSIEACKDQTSTCLRVECLTSSKTLEYKIK